MRPSWKRQTARVMAPVVVLAAAALPTAAADFDSVGPGSGALVGVGSSCGTLLFNADGTYEGGYAWQYGGVVPPDYGAFAECYSADAGSCICSTVFHFSQVGSQNGQTMDTYVWDDASGAPGSVLDVVVGFDPGPVGFWPSISEHVSFIPTPLIPPASFWVGYWGNWPDGITPWFIAVDLDGFGGCPFTNVAPGIGYPTGWVDVSVVWGPTQALGIACEVVECPPVPVMETTWGRIKSLHR